jgi:hypothetical protein
MSVKVVIVSCSQRPEEGRGELLLCQSFDHGGFARFAELDMVWGNAEGLPVVYNRKLEQYSGKDVEFLVFSHDDVYLDDLKLGDKLEAAHRNLGYQIIGAAGAARVKVAYPSLWHVMSEPRDRRGYVHHFSETGQVFCTSFGLTPSEVVVLDGLFVAVHLPSVLASGWRFNENYEFHHYDLASCLDAATKGLKVGVYPIHMIHQSPGLDSFSNPSWRSSNERFLAEYGSHPSAL